MPDYESFEEEEIYIFRKEISSDAYINRSYSKTINSNSKVKKSYSETINSNAQIKKLDNVKTITSDSVLSKSYSKTIISNASIKQTYTVPSPAGYDVTYTFPDLATAEEGWDYVGPDHSGLKVKDTDGAWCWTSTGTVSNTTGPPTGVPCVYTETSSPVTGGDVFTMTLTTAINAGSYSLYVTFDRCTYGTASAHLYFEAWDGSEWQPIDDWAGDSTTTFTSEGPYDFTSYTNADFKIRFRTVVGGTAYYNDMAVDTVRIYGDPVSLNSNAFIKKLANEETIASDGHILKVGTKTLNSNSYIEKITSKEIDSDAWVLEVQSETINSNTKIKKLATEKTIASNYYLKKPGTEGSINSNSKIKKLANEETVTSDGWIQEVQSGTIDIDAYVKKIDNTETILSDAEIIMGVVSKTIKSNSEIKKIDNEETINSDYWIGEIQSATIDSDSHIIKVISKTLNSDAFIKKLANEETVTSNYIIKKLAIEGSITSDMFLGYLSQTKTINSNAYIAKTAITKTIISDMQIGWLGQTETINCDLVIRRAFEGSIRCNYHIFASPTGSVTSDYKVKKLGTSKTIISNNYIKKPDNTNTINSDSWIRRCYGGKALDSLDVNMVSLYHMDEPDWSGVPSEVIDSKGTNHGIAMALTTTTPNGLFNKAGIFSGTNTGINLGNGSSFHTNIFTISVWIYPTATSNNYNEIMSSGRHRLTLRSTGKAQWWVSVLGVGWINAESDSAIPLNKWTHLVGSYNGSTAKLYVNSVLQSNTGSGSGTIPWAGNTIYVGQSGGDTNEYVGKIDDLAFWNIAKSQSDIDSIWKEYTFMFSDYKIKKLGYQTTINSNSYIEKSIAKTISSDYKIKKLATTKTITSDSYIEKASSKTINSNAWILEVQSGTINSDYKIFVPTSKTINSNYHIKKLATEKELVSDAYIKKLAYEGSINSNGNIKGIYSKTINSNSIIKKLAYEGSITSDSKVKKTATQVTLSSSMVIRTVTVEPIYSNSSVKATYTKTITTGAHVIRLHEGNINCNYYIKQSYSETINSNNYIKKIGNSKTITVDTYITRVGVTQTISSDYYIKKSLIGSIGSNATIKKLGTSKSINSNSYVAELHIISQAITSNYYLKKRNIKTITSDATILTPSGDIISNAYIKGRPTKDINMSICIRSQETTKPWVCVARYINKPIIVSANSLSYSETIV